MKITNNIAVKPSIKDSFRTAIAFLVISCLFASCTKDFLDEKPSSSIVSPESLQDFQKLLDNYQNFEMTEVFEYSSDEYYWLFTDYNAQGYQYRRNFHIWSTDIYTDVNTVADWNILYQHVFYANVVLNGLKKIERNASNANDFDKVKGGALQLRALAFYTAAQIWSPPYDAATASIDLGIPLRLDPDINLPTTRSSVMETYSQVLTDLKEAESLVTNMVDVNHAYRASKPAIKALLARVYLTMRNYENAFKYANECLQMHDKILDYNTISTTANAPFPLLNEEIILYRRIGTLAQIGNRLQRYIIDTSLYQSYVENDLRRSVFFSVGTNGAYRKNDYCGTINFKFCGIATDEVLLMRAECYARDGKTDLAMQDVNTLLRKRYVTGSYTNITANSADEALNIVLAERRKELINRSLRWIDARRLNKEGRNISFKRVLGGEEYVLPPNDKRWTLPIPPDVLALTGIQQNER